VFSNPGGGWEYPIFLIVISVVVALQAQPASMAVESPRTRPQLRLG